MNYSERRIIAVDGHDGTGKTTLAKRLASALGGTYIRPYGQPFGAELMRAAEAEDYAAFIQVGNQAVDQAIGESSLTDLLVFDRLWITLFTLLPKSEHNQWIIRPPTAICWADLDTTLARLSGRKEVAYERQWHEQYIRIYWKLAHQYQCQLVPTHQLDEEQALAKLVTWAKSYLSQKISHF